LSRQISEELKDKHNHTPKIAYALYDFVKLEDCVFDHLSQIRFGPKKVVNPL
jgi:hypothetical protein